MNYIPFKEKEHFLLKNMSKLSIVQAIGYFVIFILDIFLDNVIPFFLTMLYSAFSLAVCIELIKIKREMSKSYNESLSSEAFTQKISLHDEQYVPKQYAKQLQALSLKWMQNDIRRVRSFITPSLAFNVSLIIFGDTFNLPVPVLLIGLFLLSFFCIKELSTLKKASEEHSRFFACSQMNTDLIEEVYNLNKEILFLESQEEEFADKKELFHSLVSKRKEELDEKIALKNAVESAIISFFHDKK